MGDKSNTSLIWPGCDLRIKRQCTYTLWHLAQDIDCFMQLIKKIELKQM